MRIEGERKIIQTFCGKTLPDSDFSGLLLVQRVASFCHFRSNYLGEMNYTEQNSSEIRFEPSC